MRLVSGLGEGESTMKVVVDTRCHESSLFSRSLTQLEESNLGKLLSGVYTSDYE